jgi:hypothetical protein
MRIGEIFRYARPYKPEPEKIGDLPNYFHEANTPGCKLPLLDSGINPIQKINASGDLRCPAILISSSPHKIGSAETPWQDYFDPDNGHIRYYGDNKEPGVNPTSPKGNRALLEQFELHTSNDKAVRASACPILFFKRVRVGSRSKGNVQFQGFGVIKKAERITQLDRKQNQPFTNYVFDFVVFAMDAEKEVFDWQWISARRDENNDAMVCHKYAPASWKRWINGGPKVLESCRRRVVKLMTYSTDEQIPTKGSKEEKVLSEIYNFYDGRKARFESLASEIAARIIDQGSGQYRQGWITPPSSDHGADFVGLLEIGSEIAKAKLIVLGQAKCEKRTTATNGKDIARTVARLRRGWVGVYVTTSYFSIPVQREVLEDRFPIILVNGLRLAQETLEIVHEQAFKSVEDFLLSVDSSHDARVIARDPEELLFE